MRKPWGVELGQIFALLFILLVLNIWRRFDSYYSFSVITNTLLMSSGLILFGYQMAGFIMAV